MTKDDETTLIAKMAATLLTIKHLTNVSTHEITWAVETAHAILVEAQALAQKETEHASAS